MPEDEVTLPSALMPLETYEERMRALIRRGLGRSVALDGGVPDHHSLATVVSASLKAGKKVVIHPVGVRTQALELEF